jgi:hypothetical protein
LRTVAASIALALLFFTTGAIAQVPRVLGTWELDLQASDIPKGFPVASETRSYDLRNDGYLVNIVIRKAPNGHPYFIEVVSKSDGKDYPQYQWDTLAELQISGTKMPVTYSETVLNEYSVNVIAKFNGRVATKGVRRVSPDGKTMKIEVVNIDQNGKETPLSLVFNRVEPPGAR